MTDPLLVPLIIVLLAFALIGAIAIAYGPDPLENEDHDNPTEEGELP